ncbi:N-acetyltransferase [Alteraurantiacibacter aestuarii]|uniref:GNAT family N-acetyltransferase n=1 Tax=Alteraurantiacibacter aestuarii TaxID=650004 RepID=A0A844ZNB0_9SPHN|nr:GNAT family N-acetyltransferase [Alteraurantiacibacter aestuarii]MXO89163.1 GNAT family N-acetyltransferase [Alteraurantiacibacter aestuarii]
MILRPATPQDAAALAHLGRHSFCAAFEHLYRPEDLSAFLEKAYSVEEVASQIADPATLYCLTSDAPGGALTGFCKMKYPASYEGHSDAQNPIVLAQLYTDPDVTGKGIGAALMEWALEQAKARQCDAVQLSVWSENFGAQRFYARHGFTKIADIDFWVGQQRDEEFLLELRL